MIPIIILVRPQFSGNLGSVARAMKNMGIQHLRLVAPKASAQDEEARKMAMRALDVLGAAKTYATLAEAISDLDLSVATSRRWGKDRSNFIPLREWSESSAGFPVSHRVGIVFGTEVTGLLNEEIALCQKIVTIPSHDDYASLNLAQAVMVVCYELMVASSAKGFSVPDALESDAANTQDFEAMVEDLKKLLWEAGFLDMHNPEHLMRLLRNLFNRARPSENEVKIFRGICRQLRWWKENG